MHDWCPWSPERVLLDPLEMELQMVVSLHLGGGTITPSSGRAASALNGGAISPAWKSIFFNVYGALPVCMSMQPACVCLLPVEARIGDQPTGTGVTDICEPPCGCWVSNPTPLQDLWVLFNNEPSLQSDSCSSRGPGFNPSTHLAAHICL